MVVYTIGYWGRTVLEFIDVLRENNITVVVDVRRFPKSSDVNFNRENLERYLLEHRIKYMFLGEALGGFVRGGYERYMETEKFREGFKVLIKLVESETVAIMCKERKVEHCHRRFIARCLEDLNIEVKHV